MSVQPTSQFSNFYPQATGQASSAAGQSPQGGFDSQALQSLLAGIQQQAPQQQPVADQFGTSSQAAPNTTVAYGTQTPGAEAYPNTTNAASFNTYNPTPNSFSYGSGVTGTAADPASYGTATTAAPSYANNVSYSVPTTASPVGAENNPFAAQTGNSAANTFSTQQAYPQYAASYAPQGASQQQPAGA